jgi:anti-sigma B factor antagonist
MKVVHEDHDRISILSVVGDLTSDHVDAFRRLVNERFEAGIRDFVVQLNEMPIIDSDGLESLLWLQDKAAELLGQVRLVEPTDDVSTILRITRLATQFDCRMDVTEAVRSLR